MQNRFLVWSFALHATLIAGVTLLAGPDATARRELRLTMAKPAQELVVPPAESTARPELERPQPPLLAEPRLVPADEVFEPPAAAPRREQPSRRPLPWSDAAFEPLPPLVAERPGESAPDLARDDTEPPPEPPPPQAPAPRIEARVVPGHNPPPDYPRVARRRGLQGAVLVRAHVTVAGTVAHVEVLRSSGHDVLDRAALAAVRRWQFYPASQAGRPITDLVDHEFEFQLRG